ncbi:glycosyltransferase family 2 protein [Lentzea tibetensis]|uniref:glycosyltransferase family 2 protein n=1 Tax=Lentzea tibetensis TaxID=2591470 RepID=UPI001F1A94EA|nr:glycosyltransferase [Lentzea tibetensis]
MRHSGITVVGIPARNEATTVASVARAADEGLRQAFPNRTNVIVLADNGSTDGTADRFLDADLHAHQIVVRSTAAGTGKGTNVFAIADKARELGADRVLLLDADVRSTEPQWIERLATAVDDDSPVLALPTYRRNRFEANTTNHLASPLLAAIFGVHVQQPIGGEFAFNAAFLERMTRWPRPASAYLYGIDIWLTANALREHLRVAEVPLGRKVHNSPFPKILHLPQQVLDSLFHVVSQLDRVRPAFRAAPVKREAVDGEFVRQDPDVIARVTTTTNHYLKAYQPDIQRLLPSARILGPAPWGLWVGADDWPHLLADAVEALADGCFEAARDHLVALYVNRVLTFWDEIDGLSGPEIDELLDRQAADTVRAVKYRSITFDHQCNTGGFDAGLWAALDEHAA